MADLVAIDNLFERFLNGACNPDPLFPMTFLLRAHSAYRAGASAVMAGQCYESQALLRLCLEHSSYAFFIGKDEVRMELRLRRGDSDDHRRNVRKEFHNDRIKKYIRQESQELYEQFGKLYERLIEYGAHPNELGFSANSIITRENGNIRFDVVYLQPDGPQLDLALKTAAQVGLWALIISRLLYPERCALLRISSDLDNMLARF